MRLIALALCLLALAGCAQKYRLGPNMTAQDGYAAVAYCNAQANRAAGGGSDFTSLAIFQQNRDYCLRGKGLIPVR